MPPQRHLPPSTHPKVRVRSARACAPCRRRKIKCDAIDPCAACVGYGYDCVYIDPPPRARHTSAPRTGSEAPAQTAMVAEVTRNGDSGEINALPEPVKINEPFLCSISTVECTTSNPLLIKALKTRFTSIHSAIAVPRKLGMELGMDSSTPAPRLQSFGWNPGTRSEPKVYPNGSLSDIISYEQSKDYSDICFNYIHPFFGAFHRDVFEAKAKAYWHAQERGVDFEACMCGVVALGSYFAKTALPVEREVVEHGRHLLDFTIAHPPAQLSIKHVNAWILRAIYLRCTTRPHLSWMASCNSLHIAEAIGMHREVNNNQFACEKQRDVDPLEVDLRRRTFWVGISLNQFLASEYGRTRVPIDMISCEPFPAQAGDFTSAIVEIMSSVPKTQDFTTVNITDLLTSLRKTSDIPVKGAFLGLLRADACFCIYRMLKCTNVILPVCRVEGLLEVIRVALTGVKFLCSMEHPWWNLIGTPFHCVCVLLSLSTAESLNMIPQALETLKNATILYDTHLSNEALKTAKALVQAAKDKRKREIERLDRGLDAIGEIPPDPLTLNGAVNGDTPYDYSTENGMTGFMDFLDLNNYFNNDGDAFIFM